MLKAAPWSVVYITEKANNTSKKEMYKQSLKS